MHLYICHCVKGRIGHFGTIDVGDMRETARAPATQVLVGPEPIRWQPVPSAAPIAVQVAVFVELPSPQTVAASEITEVS